MHSIQYIQYTNLYSTQRNQQTYRYTCCIYWQEMMQYMHFAKANCNFSFGSANKNKKNTKHVVVWFSDVFLEVFLHLPQLVWLFFPTGSSSSISFMNCIVREQWSARWNVVSASAPTALSFTFPVWQLWVHSRSLVKLHTTGSDDLQVDIFKRTALPVPNVHLDREI